MTDQPQPPQPDDTSRQADSSSEATPRRSPISSEDLLQGMREILIAHAGEIYRLRLTRNGKLILTK